MRICSVDVCEKKHQARGYCEMHYSRLLRTGDPLTAHIPRRPVTAIADRLAAKSAIDGDCLVFTGKTTQRSGHKTIHVDGRAQLVHRLAWALANGPIPAGLCVCHRCDNPPCIRIDHLFLGTPADNNADRDRKGRQRCPRGSSHPRARLTEYQVAEIKVYIEAGQSTYDLAARYGVNQGTIWNIGAGRTWARVEPAAWLAHLSGAKRTPGGQQIYPTSKECAACGNEFALRPGEFQTKRTCSSVCHKALMSRIARARFAANDAMALDGLGHPLVDMPAVNRAALDAIAWPMIGATS